METQAVNVNETGRQGELSTILISTKTFLRFCIYKVFKQFKLFRFFCKRYSCVVEGDVIVTCFISLMTLYNLYYKDIIIYYKYACIIMLCVADYSLFVGFAIPVYDWSLFNKYVWYLERFLFECLSDLYRMRF